MIKSLILIEDAADLKRALAHLRQTGRDPKSCLLVNFNSNFKVDSRQTGGIPIRSEEDYLRFLDLEPLNHTALHDARLWLEHPEVRGLMTYQGIFLGLAVERHWVRGVTTLYKYAELLNFVLQKEKPSEIVVFKETPSAPQTELKFSEKDKIAFKLVTAAALTDCDVVVIPCATAFTPVHASFGRLLDWTARMIGRYMRKLFNVMLQMIPSEKAGNILVTGAPRIMFPVLKALKTRFAGQLIYFQSRTSPRILPPLWKNRIPYVTCEDFSARSRARGGEDDLGKFLEIVQRNGFFRYKNFGLIKALDDKLIFLFTEKMPQIRHLTDIFRVMLRTLRCRLVLADEESGELSRCLMLVAQQMNIRTAEYQHGVITKYFLEYGIADKKLVWGNYFKEKIIEQLHYGQDRIAVVGPLHYDRAFGGAGATGVPVKCGVLEKGGAVAPARKVVLYTPHPFHKGAKGGVLNRHLTQTEAEEMLEEVVESIGRSKNLFLAVKLHHADDQYAFYEQFLKTRLAAGSFRVIRKGTVYDLLLVSDALVTPISTAILEAILLDKPLILLNLRDKKLVFPYVEWKAVPCITKRGGLLDELRRCLADPVAYQQLYREGRQRIRYEFADIGGHNPLQKFISEIDMLLQQDFSGIRETAEKDNGMFRTVPSL